MARPRETFNKKELEKNRQKKKNEKQKKKDERKANAGSGKSMDDMIAYVDAYGNIVSSPPDKIKNDVRTEDIKISTSKKEDIEAEVIRKGTVSTFNDSRGFGFIIDHQNQDSIFFHVSNIVNEVKQGDKVTFEIMRGPKGFVAVNVQLITT